MPIERGKDSKGLFYRWGKSGKKYYYKANNSVSRSGAKKRARKQGQAIEISKKSQ